MMMKKGKQLLCAALVASLAVGSVTSLAACNPEEPLKDSPLSGATLADFTQGEAETFFASDGWDNGDVFNVTWSKKNLSYADNALKLSITESASTAEGALPYLAGEARSYQYFGYGDYSVKMKPAKVTGTASTFFVCTGPYDEDEEGNPNPHDEIDIEFLGNDTTKVQFNYFVNGTGGHEYMYDLGFDASAEYHEYGFRWAEDHIVWFVDNKPVYKVTAEGDNKMPSTAGRILMNHWCGTEEAEGWMGEYSGSDGKTCDYAWVKTSATPIGKLPDPTLPTDPDDVPQEGWTDIDYSGFGGWSGYTIDKTDGLTISHEAAKSGWACEGMALTNSYSWVKFNIKNNDEKTATVRVDVKKEGGAGAVSGVICDSDAASLSAADSAALIEFAGGEALDVVLKIKDMYVDQFVVFLNSTSSTDGVATGSITFTGLQGIVNENAQPPETPDPEVPEGDNCVLSFTSTDVYTVDKSGVAAAELTATYSDVTGASYANIAADVATLAADKDTFSVKVTNNSERNIKIRIDLIGEQKATVGDNANMECCNLSATASKDVGIYTDTTWGGTTFTLAAGDTVIITITYSNANAMGAVQRVQLYMDSFTESDRGNDVHYTNGSVTFGEFKFYSSAAEAE